VEKHDVVVLSIIKQLSTLCGKVQFEIFAPLECCMAVVVSLLHCLMTTYQSWLLGSSSPRRPLKMGLILCPETLVTKYQPMPHNIPKEERSQLHCWEAQKISQNSVSLLQHLASCLELPLNV
jgi:hypothetical protein